VTRLFKGITKKDQMEDEYISRLEEQTRLGILEDTSDMLHQKVSQQRDTDPYGKSAHEKGSKLDEGKQQADLVLRCFARALSAVCDVGTMGAIKYTPEGWIDVPDGIQRYGNAQMRHYLKRSSGEVLDQESGLHHQAHEIWNAMAQLELLLREQEK